GHLLDNNKVTNQRPRILQAARVTEVRHENSAGRLTDGGSLRADEEGHARWVVRYPEGFAGKIEIFDRSNRLVREDVLRPAHSHNKLIVDFERDNVPIRQAAAQSLALDPLTWKKASDARSEITRHDLTFDGNGCLVEIRYQTSDNEPRHDAQASFGRRFTYSPEGLVLSRTEIGLDGRPITLKDGLRTVSYTYDRDRNPTGRT